MVQAGGLVHKRAEKVLSRATYQDSYLEQVAGAFDLARMLNMDDLYHAEVFRPMTYKNIHEKKWFQRNAAIALGNSRDERYVPDLAQAIRDPEEVVREYVPWGLGRIGGARAKRVLEESLVLERSETVRRGDLLRLAEIAVRRNPTGPRRTVDQPGPRLRTHALSGHVVCAPPTCATGRPTFWAAS